MLVSPSFSLLSFLFLFSINDHDDMFNQQKPAFKFVIKSKIDTVKQETKQEATTTSCAVPTTVVPEERKRKRTEKDTTAAAPIATKKVRRFLSIHHHPQFFFNHVNTYRFTVNWSVGTGKRRNSNMNQTFKQNKRWPNLNTLIYLPWLVYYVNANSNKNQIWNDTKLYLNFTKYETMYNIYIHRYPNVHIVAQTRGKGEECVGEEEKEGEGKSSILWICLFRPC